MARLQIPKTSPVVKRMCTEAGVTLKRFKSPDDFEQEAVKFIEKHDMVFLATSAKDVPRCTPLGYRNIGTTLYILSEGGGKFANLKKNKRIAYAIASRIEGGRNLLWVQGLQCWGTAEVIYMKQEPERFQELLDKLGVTTSLKQRGIKSLPPFNYRLIVLVPHKMRLLNLRNGINNVTWFRRS
jgi:hypothetical protein